MFQSSVSLHTILQADEDIQATTAETREVILRLAQAFEASPESLSFTPEELTKILGIGTERHWRDFLNIPAVKQFISNRMAERILVATRKAQQALATKAYSGDVQAVKQLNELAGIFNKVDSNRTILMIRVDRTGLQ